MNHLLTDHKKYSDAIPTFSRHFLRTLINSQFLYFVYILYIFYFIILQVWTQKCAVQKASVDVNISYY
jgi:hypothetical protein